MPLSQRSEQLQEIDDMVTALDEQAKNIEHLLSPQPIHIETTYQLETALREIYSVLAILRGVKAKWIGL